VGPAERLDRYARLAVEVAVNLQPGQFLRISADPEHLPLVRAMGRIAYERGARYVEVVYRDAHLRRALIEHGPEESLDWTPPWTMALIDHLIDARGATIVITGEPEPELLADLDQRRTQRARPRLAVEKLLDAESEASLPSVAAKTGINRENYTARLRGSDIDNGRECWVLELKPRTRNKFLLAGTLWVDKKSSGIVKVDGKTAASLSMWVASPHIVEERAEVSGLWLPARTVSQSSTFLAGDSQLEIAYTGYQVHR